MKLFSSSVEKCNDFLSILIFFVTNRTRNRGFKICASALECEAVQPDKSTNILQHSLFLYVSSKMGFLSIFPDHKKNNLGKKKLRKNFGAKKLG